MYVVLNVYRIYLICTYVHEIIVNETILVQRIQIRTMFTSRKEKTKQSLVNTNQMPYTHLHFHFLKYSLFNIVK